MAEAPLVIANGAGYDDFLSELTGATVNAGRIVVTVQAVLGMYGPDVNPHSWHDIPRVPQVAAAIEAALARLDPLRDRRQRHRQTRQIQPADGGTKVLT